MSAAPNVVPDQAAATRGLDLVRRRDGAVVCRLELADSFVRRFLGLMGRGGLPRDAGLWIEPCTSIHMMFMRFSIDAVFVRRAASGRPLGPGVEGEILKVCRAVRPWIGMAWCTGATAVVELAAGRAAELGLVEGDVLTLDERDVRPNEERREGAPTRNGDDAPGTRARGAEVTSGAIDKQQEV